MLQATCHVCRLWSLGELSGTAENAAVEPLDLWPQANRGKAGGLGLTIYELA